MAKVYVLRCLPSASKSYIYLSQSGWSTQDLSQAKRFKNAPVTTSVGTPRNTWEIVDLDQAIIEAVMDS